jgi:rubrerythrin
MSEIPGIVWMGVGTVIGGMSFFLGFLKQSSSSFFFKFMTFVGVGMIIYGFIKMKLQERNFENKLEQRKTQMIQRGEMEVDIDMQENARRQQSRQPMQQQQYSQQARNQQIHPANINRQQAPRHNTGSQNFCHQCGTPLLKHHKYCPICGARIK